MEQKAKTRDLSVAEYFGELQREYLLAEFRRKIYFNPKDKAYYQRVMEYKKEKIDNIATRNDLKSIFNDEDKYSNIHEQLFTSDGTPLFSLTEKDRINYYAVGNEFAHEGEIWTLDHVNREGGLILYSISKQRYKSVSTSEAHRIL